MKPLIHLGAATALLTALNLSALAQGTAFTYQGRLNDGTTTANGSYDLRFALYDAASAGAAQGNALTNAATAVSNGLFTVTLDFGNQFPGANRWLEIAVRTNGNGAFNTLTPRQVLTATPYAIYATTSTTASSANAVAAGNITGTIPLAKLPGVLVTNGASGVDLTGAFTGSGTGLTGVPLGLANSAGVVNYPGNLSTPTVLNVVSNALTATTYDFNRDGFLDLVCTEFGKRAVTVLTNDHLGGFGVAASTILDFPPTTVSVTDLDGDGRPDLVCGCSSIAYLFVLLNNGNGSFDLNAMLQTDPTPYTVVTADVNQDGWQDIISANWATNTLSILTNRRDGTFQLAYSPVVVNQPLSLAAQDVNADGKVDLICGASGSSSGAMVLTNRGDGFFVPSSTASIGATAGDLVMADVNGDGKVDFVTSGMSPDTLSVVTNAGRGIFLLAATLPTGIDPSSVAAADLNQDGWVDLLSANLFDNTLSVFTNNRSGGFVSSAVLPAGYRPYWIVAADFNGDGVADVVTTHDLTNQLSLYYNLPVLSGQFQGNGAQLTGLNASSLTSGVVADARLSANVALRSGGNTFSGNQTISGNVNVTGNLAAGSTATATGFAAQALGYSADASGNYSLALGYDSTASGHVSLAAGYQANAAHLGAFVWSDATGFPFASTADNQFLIRASGGVGIGTATPHAQLEVAGGIRARGGAPGALGANNNGYAFNGNNGDNDSGMFSSADGQVEFYANSVEVMRVKQGAVAIGTTTPTATLHVASSAGFPSAQLQLTQNNAADYSRFRMNVGANPYWEMDVSPGATPSIGWWTTSLKMNLDFNGNLMVAGNVTANGVLLTSDRAAKENFKAVSPAEVLRKVASLPITEWNYKNGPATVRHVGPMAQDFQEAFGLNGADDKHINVVDGSGVALAAIQGLNEKLEARSKKLENENAELKQELAQIKQMLTKLSATKP